MQYKRYENKIALRLDPGDEVCESIKTVAATENIRAGVVSGIGGADRIVVGVFDTEKKDYDEFEYTGTQEITSLVGNITYMDDEPLVHLHITAAGEGAKLIGGHLLAAYISLTGEIFIDVLDGEIGKTRNEELGIKEMRFV